MTEKKTDKPKTDPIPTVSAESLERLLFRLGAKPKEVHAALALLNKKSE